MGNRMSDTNEEAIMDAMSHAGLYWSKGTIAKKVFKVDYFENGKRSFSRQSYEVRFVQKWNGNVVEIDDFAGMNMPSSFSPCFQDFNYSENDEALKITGVYNGKNYEVIIHI